MPFTTVTMVAVGDSGNTAEDVAWDAVEAVIASANAGALHGFKNRLINGSFLVNQRLAATNADDTYCLDRWYVLTETGTVAVTQLTDPETGAANGIRLTQSQASAQRMGLAQIVESANCRDLRSVITTLAGRVRLSTADSVRYAVLEWTGGTDAPTSDVVNTWTNASFTAGQFFIATTTNVLAVGQVTTAAATWRDLTALNATLGASAKNIIVFVWTENAVAQNVTLDLANIQWEPGATATKFELRPFAVELALCERYYEKSFDPDVAPAQNVGNSTGEQQFGATVAGATTNRWPSVPFRKLKRVAPTMTLYNPAAANGQVRDVSLTADFSGSGTTNVSRRGFKVFATGNASTGVNNICGIHWTADAEL